MSFTLHLGENGVYIKHEGAPLLPCQVVMLADGVYVLPKRWEDECGEILIARHWRVPVNGALLIEFLPAKSKGWPW